jgi:hypothetical protein
MVCAATRSVRIRQRYARAGAVGFTVAVYPPRPGTEGKGRNTK